MNELKGCFVVQVDGARYVREIIANGNPKAPVIYYTDDLWEAKVWKTPSAARKAKDRVQKQLPSCDCRAYLFKPDEKTGKRELIGFLIDKT
ncbi:MAG: hypothetical protein E7325_02305 [Clostridiales bacterium]|nr:hypothetical protein [Clostridiales bacterium]